MQQQQQQQQQRRLQQAARRGGGEVVIYSRSQEAHDRPIQTVCTGRLGGVIQARWLAKSPVRGQGRRRRWRGRLPR